MLRIVECAASGVLLVIPDGSHAFLRAENGVSTRQSALPRKTAAQEKSRRQSKHRAAQPA